MNRKKIIIIGAGISGLAAGCYAQMNGYDSEIYEMHDLPGGLCTAWKRKDYTFDGCIHWLVGAKPDSGFYKYWQEIGALKDKTMYTHPDFFRFEGEPGQVVTLYSDVDKLEQQLLAAAPEDSAAIREITGAVRKFSKFPSLMDKPLEFNNFIDIIKMMVRMGPFMKDLRKFNSVSIADYAERHIKNQFLRELLPQVIAPEYTMFVLIINLVYFCTQDANFPIGGSLEFAKSIADNYLKLGGKINYRSRVETVIVNDNRAVGVRLAGGREVYGDHIVAAIDSHEAIFKLLAGKYINAKVQEPFDQFHTRAAIQVSLGVNCDLSNEPASLKIKLAEPVLIGGQLQHYLALKHYCYDETLAPKGKSVVVSLIASPYEYWEKLAMDHEKYKTEKQKVADAVIKLLEKRFPQTRDKVEAVDVATPVTYNRYTDIWQGSFMAWTNTTNFNPYKLAHQLPGLTGFYMSGQWTLQGGLPAALVTGRWAIQRICRRDKKQFQTNIIPEVGAK